MSQMGTIVSPVVVDIGGNWDPRVPSVIFGTFMLLGSVPFLFLPETKDRPLMQTLEDVEMEEEGTSIYQRLLNPIRSLK